MTPPIRSEIPLSQFTTLEVGGTARFWADCDSEAHLRQALAWAKSEGLMSLVLGGGSNVLVSDAGFDGLVLRFTGSSISLKPETGDQTLVRVGAGCVWDEFVATMVDEGLSGVECLSGIPGWVGAAPIQNIGAYGQEVAETLAGVRVVHRFTGAAEEIPADMLGFAYRLSRFKEDWRDRYVITRVDFRLARSPRGTVRYPALKQHLGMSERDLAPELATIRDAVLEIRREKSMVIDPDDPNRRSAGSFFVNPVVSDRIANAVQKRARKRGTSRGMPRFATADGIKLSAAWLIEEAGFPPGFGRGHVGLSSKHTLALINRGEASAAELVALASEIRHEVYRVFGVLLTPEPVFLGFPTSTDTLLAAPGAHETPIPKV